MVKAAISAVVVLSTAIVPGVAHGPATRRLAEAAPAGDGDAVRTRMRKGEKAEAVAFAKEAHAWTLELTKRGETLGRMLVDVFEGRERYGNLVRDELRSLDKWLDGKAAYFGAKPYPNFATMVAFRRVLLDYIAWERATLAAGFARYLELAEARRTPREQRWAKFVEELNALDAEEVVWKDKVKTAEDAIYTATNRQ